MSAQQEKKPLKNILLIAVTRMGDMLQASPTIAGLKLENPGARITVAIDKTFASICEGIPGIDDVFVLDLSYVVRCLAEEGEGVVEGFRYLTEVVDKLRAANYDYCLNMSSSPYTALLMKMVDAPNSRGWNSDEEGYRIISNPWAMLFAAFVYHSNRDYNGLNLVDIFRCAAGVTEHPLTLRYEPNASDERFAEEFLAANVPPVEGPLLFLQAGASQAKRQWAPKKFAALAKQLIEQLHAKVVLIGAKSEQPIIDEILKHYTHPRFVSALGKTNFGELAALLRRGDLLITGDTGPMHLSVSVGTPVVSLFLASALCYETGPYSVGNFVMQPQISCNPCNPNYPCANTECHDQITPEMVVQLTQLRLSTPLGQEAAIELPKNLREQSDVAIYITEFDRDGFLLFKRLAGGLPRRGEPIGFYETMRNAYMALWKEEFEGIVYQEVPPRLDAPPVAPHPSLAALHEAVALSTEGLRTLDTLLHVVRSNTHAPERLKEINESLQRIDQQIEEVGLATPPLGALVRIFMMEKDNMRGADIFELSAHAKKLYENLDRRSRRFGQLFAHFDRSTGPKGLPVIQ